MIDRCAANLEKEHKEQFAQMVFEFTDIFAEDGKLGRTSKIKHSIHTGDAQPIRQPVRRVPLFQRHEMQNLHMEMQAKDVIQPSQSPWTSPVVLVQKKNNRSICFCIDYHKLNAVTRKDVYLIPRIDDTLEVLAGSQLVLNSGYCEWVLEGRDGGGRQRENCFMYTPNGLFEFKVMPFGLCNGPATFQRLMNLVLAGLTGGGTFFNIGMLILHKVV